VTEDRNMTRLTKNGSKLAISYVFAAIIISEIGKNISHPPKIKIKNNT
jgi:hypothetical protein